MKTIAAVIRENGGEFSLEEVTLDPPRFGEVLVRNLATGVCHSDIVVQHGMVFSPRILGHEGAGIIEEVGPGVTHLSVGDKVIMVSTHVASAQIALPGSPSPVHHSSH